MTWQLLWSAAAKRDLAKIDRQVSARIVRAAVRCAETGHGDLSRLRPPLDGYRLRVGDWRLLLELDEPSGTMRVVRVLHRREAYREE